jgi:hypothetical protein
MPCRAAVFAAALAVCVVARAAGACDSASCVLVTRGQDNVGKGVFSVDLSFRYSDESKRLLGSSTSDNVVIPRIDFDGQRLLPGFHRELSGDANSLQADVAYGLTSRLTLQASLPLFSRKAYAHAHLPVTTPPPTDPGTGEPLPDEGHGHGGPAAPVLIDRNYTTDGFGDTLVGASYAVWGTASQRLTAAAALKLPTGQWKVPNRYDGGLHDPMLQPGTGSMGYLLAALFSHGGSSLSWAASGSYQIATANDLQYSFGDEAILGLGMTRALRPVQSRTMVAASVQVKAHFRARSTYLDAPVPSTGGRMVILSPGLRLNTAGGFGFYAYLQLPVYSYVNDTQLTTRSSILTGITKGF